MEPTRGKRTRRGEKIVGRFLPLLRHVTGSAQYLGLSHPARSLLVLIGMQHTGYNNGKLVATPKYLHTLGWTSNDMTTRCLRELMGSGLLVRTRVGGFPNRPAWYAITWLSLDVTEGLDEIDPKRYRPFVPEKFVIPPQGISAAPARPSQGIRGSASVPSDGAMEANSANPLSRRKVSI
jgi:hypothetical protein